MWCLQRHRCHRFNHETATLMDPWVLETIGKVCHMRHLAKYKELKQITQAIAREICINRVLMKMEETPVEIIYRGGEIHWLQAIVHLHFLKKIMKLLIWMWSAKWKGKLSLCQVSRALQLHWIQTKLMLEKATFQNTLKRKLIQKRKWTICLHLTL